MEREVKIGVESRGMGFELYVKVITNEKRTEDSMKFRKIVQMAVW